MPRDSLEGFPFFSLAFDKQQKPVRPDDRGSLLEADDITDLFVVSHGWNNDMRKARELYHQLFAQTRALLQKQTPKSLKNRVFGVAGIFWPSMKFAEKDLIPGGSASLRPDVIEQVQDAIAAARPRDVPYLKKIAAGVQRPAMDEETIAALRGLLVGIPQVKGEPRLPKATLMRMDDSELIDRLAAGGARPPKPIGEVGGTTGVVFSKPFGAIKNGINLYTFWTMKDRAGKTGADGLAPVLDRFRKEYPDARIHLVGHSFGARLVTAAAQAGKFAPSTLTLLQAAFSHNSFSENGAFRSLIAESVVRGPILITHSERDSAVGLAYPMAVRLTGDSLSSIGGKNDAYGALGRNGAQRTGEAVDTKLLAVGSKYPFDTSGKIYNLEANSLILGHSDIAKPEVAFAVLSAIADAK